MRILTPRLTTLVATLMSNGYSVEVHQGELTVSDPSTVASQSVGCHPDCPWHNGLDNTVPYAPESDTDAPYVD